MKNTYRILICSLAFSALCLSLVNRANAEQWMAYYDASSCPTGPGYYQGPSSGQDGPYASQAECASAINSARMSYSLPACAAASCRQVDGSSSGSSAGGVAGQISQGATNSGSNAATMLEIGIVSAVLIGSMQDAKKHKAEEAAREAKLQAEMKRQQAERDRKNEQIKQNLLGENKGNDPSSLSLIGVTDEPQLQLMTGDQAVAPLATNSQSVNHQSALNTKHTKSKAFNKGYRDASECYSQNAGPYCANLSGKSWQTCLDDYRAGYDVGRKVQQQNLVEAMRTGFRDAQSGRKANAMFDARANGGCHTEWVNAYQDGYFQSAHSNK
jgi:hypothetical protein